MKRKILCILSAMMFAFASFYGLRILVCPATCAYFDVMLEALTEAESHTCWNGGPGASACSISAGITILGQGVTTGCTVTCNTSYYACCGIHCICIPN